MSTSIMDIDYSRPSSSQLVRNWNEFKQNKFKLLISDFPAYRPPEPVAYRKLGCNHNQFNVLERDPLDWLLQSLNTNIYQLVLWEERVANCLMSIERGRDPVYLTDHIAHQWGGYRRTEVIVRTQ